MGLGISIETIAIEWPIEDVPSRCPQCGSALLLTRYRRFPERALPPEIAAQESEQLCGVCGAPACDEDERPQTVVLKNRNQDFFSGFRK
ncbi:MAG: hypothetical protein GH145_02390 [Firmicutes bacterium]|nr:hypothetical protein [Bacillota bacterium]